jgi:hypothetical protein
LTGILSYSPKAAAFGLGTNVMGFKSWQMPMDTTSEAKTSPTILFFMQQTFQFYHLTIKPIFSTKPKTEYLGRQRVANARQ